MPEQSRPLAGSDVPPRARHPRPPFDLSRPLGQEDPFRDHLTLAILGGVVFAIVVIALVAHTLYNSQP